MDAAGLPLAEQMASRCAPGTRESCCAIACAMCPVPIQPHLRAGGAACMKDRGNGNCQKDETAEIHAIHDGCRRLVMPPARPAPTPAPRLTHPACDGPCDLVAPSPTRGGQTLRVGLRRNGNSRHDAKSLVMSMMFICALPTVGEMYSTLHQSDLEILEAFESAKQYCFAFASGGTDGKGQSGSRKWHDRAGV